MPMASVMVITPQLIKGLEIELTPSLENLPPPLFIKEA
jgi:hypothetical protein